MAVDGVNGVSSNGNSGGATPAASKSMADYQTFLKLLTAEMRNQDPTNPMDSTEYVAQLASFSQVEQSVQLNAKLSMILESNAMAQADAVLGRHITSQDGESAGIVKEVIIASDGIVAVTEDGTKIPVYPGVVIAAEAPPPAEPDPAPAG